MLKLCDLDHSSIDPFKCDLKQANLFVIDLFNQTINRYNLGTGTGNY